MEEGLGSCVFFAKELGHFFVWMPSFLRFPHFLPFFIWVPPEIQHPHEVTYLSSLKR